VSSTTARWIAVSVFVCSAVLNYLDRQVLATMVDIWRSRPDFPFTYSDYGILLSVFSLAYAISAPFMGWFLDRVGLNLGITISVSVWALASFGTGFVHGFHELLLCRAVLGVAEASGVSAVGKMVGMYLLPKERAVGSAMGQLGLSVGAGLAPRFAVFFAYEYDWRWAFYVAGALSLLWIPLWLFTSRRIPPAVPAASAKDEHSAVLVRDPRLWILVVANFISMTVYSLWTNWSPTYLVRVHHLRPSEAANYSWIVPIAGYLGAIVGGSLSWQLIKRGFTPVEARKRVCLLAACALVITSAIPLMPTPALATLGMSLSFFLIGAWSTNLYTIPVDLYGAARAGFGVSALVFAYGAMQAVVSRPLGYVIEQYGFQPVCLTFGVLPLIAYALLATVIRTPKEQAQPVLDCATS
jgi:ACS family hexuronate transporter-like MFS transporter